MTIQVAIMNGYGLAMASDRHVFRGGAARSDGEEAKILRLRGPVPGAMMASGPFAVFGQPVSRLALRLEDALAEAAPRSRPEALGEAVLLALERNLDSHPDPEADRELLAETAEHVLEHALGTHDDPEAGLGHLLRELEAAPGCRDREAVEASGRLAWEANAATLPDRMSRPVMAEALRATTDLCGRAVVGALGRDWRRAAEFFLIIGLCCPATGVPVLLGLRAWRGLGRRLHVASRLDHPFECAWNAGRTVILAQGTGGGAIEAMIDGVGEEQWRRLPPAERDAARPAMTARWDAAHARLAVSSPRELAGVAAGLVRGAEVLGFLTRASERSVLEVDTVLLTPRGLAEFALPPGPAFA